MTRKLRVYVAGPMESAGGNWNLPLFDFVTEKLRAAGCEVFCPAEHLRRAHGSVENIKSESKAFRKLARREALKEEIIWVMNSADVVFMLPGWERSPGAKAEHAVASAMGIHIREAEHNILMQTEIKLDPDLKQDDDDYYLEHAKE